ncbi:hypothetical protein MW887_003892 [Aspergillus wentii]|nr:hypothetical protein MW887_003892 [Aspergillus wentii]
MDDDMEWTSTVWDYARGLHLSVAGQSALLILVLVIWSLWKYKRASLEIYNTDGILTFHHYKTSASPETIDLDPKRYPRTEPLKDFHLASSETPAFRPFKPKYHLTMGLESLDPSDLLIFDRTYTERIALRRSLLQKYPDEIVGVTNPENARIQLAVRELYGYLFEIYLPSRYPTIFKTCYDQHGSTSVENLITHKIMSTGKEKPKSLHTMLQIIAENIDEDFFILLPHHQSNPDETYYHLEAYSACFPSGFKPRDKMGKSLAGIHGPVPGYKEKLQKSMDRFFSRLEAGKCVKRVNWSVTVDEELFSNFDKSSPAMEGKLDRLDVQDLDLDKTFLRCERQTLHRLPTSGAIVFAFHTYLDRIEDIKKEGSGEDLALAIDGLEEGSVPDMFKYKNGEKWAGAIREFLRQ